MVLDLAQAAFGPGIHGVHRRDRVRGPRGAWRTPDRGVAASWRVPAVHDIRHDNLRAASRARRARLSARHRLPRPRPARQDHVRRADLAGGGHLQHRGRGHPRDQHRPDGGLLRRLDRPGTGSIHRRRARLPADRAVPGACRGAPPQPRHRARRHHVLFLGGHLPRRPRPDTLAQGEGIHRGGPIAGGRPVADHVHRHPAERARSGPCASHAVHPDSGELRGDAVLPRNRNSAASPELGQPPG